MVFNKREYLSKSVKKRMGKWVKGKEEQININDQSKNTDVWAAVEPKPYNHNDFFNSNKFPCCKHKKNPPDCSLNSAEHWF
jgi:hypothetical protein